MTNDKYNNNNNNSNNDNNNNNLRNNYHNDIMAIAMSRTMTITKKTIIIMTNFSNHRKNNDNDYS